MKTFKQFLFSETWELENVKEFINNLHDDKRIRYRNTPQKKDNLFMATNHKEFPHAHVDTIINHFGNGNYGVNFKVNGDFERQHPMNINSSMKVLKHVHKSIDSFVRHVKPKSLRFEIEKQSKDNLGDARNVLYKSLAHKIAKKHNGQVTTDNTYDRSGDVDRFVTHRVHFYSKKKDTK